jgi:hypothetical protein
MLTVIRHLLGCESSYSLLTPCALLLLLLLLAAPQSLAPADEEVGP